MELRLEDINFSYKGKKILKNINYSFNSSCIYGITGNGKTVLAEIIDNLKNIKGTILVDNTNLIKNDKLKYRRIVSLVRQNNIFFTNKVKDEMLFIINNLNYKCSDINKKMLDSLLLVGLDSSYINRNINTLSESEKTLVNIACNLLTNPKVIIFDEIFVSLDLIKRNNIIKVIKKLKEKDKIIIINSNDSNLLYKLTDKVIILKDGNILLEGNTDKVYKDYKTLDSENIEIPYLIDFTYKAKKKKVKLSYHKDILDLIKDVYKHV